MRLAIIFAILPLVGCTSTCPVQPPPVPRVVDTGCDWIPSLSASTNDTPATKQEIVAYETARQQNCRKHRDARTSTPGK